jgi:hypothetical protein
MPWFGLAEVSVQEARWPMSLAGSAVSKITELTVDGECCFWGVFFDGVGGIVALLLSFHRGY